MNQAVSRPCRPATLAMGLFLLLLLSPGPNVQAQALHELLGGSVGGISTDEFSCFRPQGSPSKPCNLSFRYYCVDVPDEINSPARPTEGYPRYKRRRKLYLADVLHTGNFPKATLLGPGHTWHLLWDGIKDPQQTNHVGYYAAMSQVVELGEIGNPASQTCLPVVGQYACFGKKTAKNTNRALGTPAGDLEPIGGLSPIPVPILVENGTEALSFIWEQAAGQVSRDGAALPILGYQLYIYPNPVSLPTEKQLKAAAKPLKVTLPLETTSFDLSRGDPAVAGAVTLSAAIRLVYRGDIESTYFSANGPASGLTFPDTAATQSMDDAGAGAPGVSRAIDIENLFLEVRVTGKNDAHPGTKLFYATVDLVGDPVGKLQDGTRVDLFIDFNEEGLGETFDEPGRKDPEDLTLSATFTRHGKEVLKPSWSGMKGLGTYSKLETSEGRVIFAVPMNDLLDAVSNEKLRASDVGGHRRRLLIWAASTRGKDVDRVPNTNDGEAPSVGGEVIKFTFQDAPQAAAPGH